MWSFKTSIFNVSNKCRAFNFIPSFPDKIKDTIMYQASFTYYGGPQLSHQIQIAHIKNKLLKSNIKLLTSRTKSLHQIQSPDIKTRIKRSAVGERKLVSTWCNHHTCIVVSRYFICNITVRTGYTTIHSCTQPYIQPYIAVHNPT